MSDLDESTGYDKFQTNYLRWLETMASFITYKVIRDILADCKAINDYSKSRIECGKPLGDRSDSDQSENERSPPKGDGDIKVTKTDWKTFINKLEHTLKYHLVNLPPDNRAYFMRNLCRSASVAESMMNAWNII